MSSRKKLSLNTVSVSLGCSCSRPKLSLLFHPKPRKTTPKPHKRHHYSSSSSWTTNDDDMETTTTATTTTTTSTTTLSPTAVVSKNDAKQKRKAKKTPARGFGRVGGEGVAVEKDSDDPYLDFRQSMLQMILENEIYSKDDLRELLNCFLQLNSPSHHGIIVRAFTEIWDGVFSVTSGQAKLHYNNNNKNDNNSHYYYNDARDYYYNYNY